MPIQKPLQRADGPRFDQNLRLSNDSGDFANPSAIKLDCNFETPQSPSELERDSQQRSRSSELSVVKPLHPSEACVLWFE